MRFLNEFLDRLVIFFCVVFMLAGSMALVGLIAVAINRGSWLLGLSAIGLLPVWVAFWSTAVDTR